MNKILIVGSGPAAYGFLKGIKDFKATQVTLIDNSNITFSQPNCMFNIEQSYYGNRLGDIKNVIEHNDFSQLKNIPYISKSFGGFSNVWGGTMHDTPDKLKNKLKDQDISLEDEFKEIYGQIKKISKGKNEDKNVIETPSFLGLDYFKNKNLLKNINYKYSLTAINDEIIALVQKNSICDRCGNYSWSCNSNSIWNTKKYIKSLIENGSIKYLPNTKLISFYEEDKIVICNLLDNKVNYKLNFNKLIIGAGPIGSSVIYLNSRIVDKVVINSSDLIKYPLMKFFKTKGKKDLFSDLFIDFEIEGNSYFSQLYFFSKGVLILSPYSHNLKKIINSLPEIFINFFGGIFVYLDQDISSKLIIKRKNKKINFDFVDLNKLRRNSYLITKFFTKNKLFLIPFLKNVHKFGTSNHLGGQFPHKNLDSDGNSSDRFGRVGSLINTHLIDGSVLPHIASGPLTLTIMANSLRIARELKL